MLVVQNHVPVLPGDRRVFVDTLAGMTAGDLPVPGAAGAAPDGRAGSGSPRCTATRSRPARGEPLDVAEVRPGRPAPRPRCSRSSVDGEILTQREHAVLARVRPVLDDATARLTLSFDGRDPVDALVDTSGRTRDGHAVRRDGRRRRPGAGAVGLVQRRCSAVPPSWSVAPADHATYQPGSRAGQTVLSDEGTVSLHSEASLERLNALLAARGAPRAAGRPVPGERRGGRLPGARRGRRRDASGPAT